MSNKDIKTLLNKVAGVYRDASRISRDASALLRCPLGQNLQPSISVLSLNDGSYYPSVLVFQGTISMVYRHKQYNIPVAIYLPAQYPTRPPVCFVRPVGNMLIKENHRHVGSDGMIYMPYFSTWNPSKNSLKDMVSSMSALFGTDPPVFSRRVATPEERMAKEKLKKDLTQKLYDHLSVFFEESREKIKSDLKDQNALSAEEKKITSELNALQQLKTELTSHCQHVDEQMKLLQSILKSASMTPVEDTNIDNLVKPADLHSEQLMNLSVENAAISDCLFFLDKALSKGNIPLDVHLKKTRELAKQQFFVRAQCMKIAHFKRKISL